MTPVMMDSEIRKACHPYPSECTSTAVTAVVALSSAATLTSSSTAMYLGTSVSTACSADDPSLADAASSFAPALEMRSSATSALAHSPANKASTAAATISQPMSA